MTPWVGVVVLGLCHIDKSICNISAFLFVYTSEWINQTNYYKYIIMMTKEGSTKIVNYMPKGLGSYAKVRPYKSS